MASSSLHKSQQMNIRKAWFKHHELEATLHEIIFYFIPLMIYDGCMKFCARCDTNANGSSDYVQLQTIKYSYVSL
jgi:hypothetical protein